MAEQGSESPAVVQKVCIAEILTEYEAAGTELYWRERTARPAVGARRSRTRRGNINTPISHGTGREGREGMGRARHLSFFQGDQTGTVEKTRQTERQERVGQRRYDDDPFFFLPRWSEGGG